MTAERGGNGPLQLRLELAEKRRVGTKLPHVIAHVEEPHGRIAVEPLQGGEVGAVEREPRVDTGHDAGKGIELGTDNGADRTVGIRISHIEIVERLSDTLEIGLPDEVRPDMGIRKPGGHDLGSGSHEVVGNVPQRVGDLDGSHVTIVEEDEIQLHASAADTLGQSSDVGAGIGRSTAEPPGEGTVGGGILPIFLLGNARTVGSPGRGTPGGQPSHAVAADGHGETVGGRETAHVVKHRSDTLGGGDVGRGGITFLPHPNAAPLIGAQLEQGSSRMGIHVKDQQPLVVQPPARRRAPCPRYSSWYRSQGPAPTGNT